MTFRTIWLLIALLWTSTLGAQTAPSFQTQYTGIYKIAYGNNAQTIATLSVDAVNNATRLELWDAQTLAKTGTVAPEDALIQDMAFHPTAPYMVTTDSAGNVFFWEINTPEPLLQVKGHEGATYAVYSPDGKYMVTNDASGVIVWDGLRFEPLYIFTLEAQTDGFTQPALINPESQLVAWLNEQNVLTIADLTTGVVLSEETLTAVTALVGLAWYDTISLAVINNGILESWDLATKQPNARFTSDVDTVAFLFHPIVSQAIVANLDGTVTLWDTKSQSVLMRLKDTPQAVYALALIPTGETLLIGSEGGFVEVIENLMP